MCNQISMTTYSAVTSALILIKEDVFSISLPPSFRICYMSLSITFKHLRYPLLFSVTSCHVALFSRQTMADQVSNADINVDTEDCVSNKCNPPDCGRAVRHGTLIHRQVTYERPRICTHTYIIHRYMDTHTYTYIHTHTHIIIYIHALQYTYIHTYTHTYIHTYIHTYADTDRQTDRQADRQTDRYLSNNYESKQIFIRKYDCPFQVCRLCFSCLSSEDKDELRRAYLEHQRRGPWRRAMPPPFKVH